MPTQTEIDECQARCDALFKQKQQELEAMKALHQKLLNESKKQEKICDDCCEELYWSKKRESELCPNCDIDESDDEEEEEEGIHKTISDEEGILACKKVFEKMKGELADAADDYWISYNYCVAQGKKRDYLSMTEENLDDGSPY
tara:strand:+ start:1251 stop:1682 length:432 start_codon:yes stop_codon:yes gene_type:complete